MSDPTNVKSPKVSLSDFIEANHKLLSALGIFTALSVFAMNLPNKACGYILSFVFMWITILMWFELFGRFPAKGASERLGMFEGLISISILLVVVAWVMLFSSIWEEVISLPIFVTILFLFLYFLSKAVKRFDLFNRIFKTHAGGKVWLRYFIGISAILLLAFISLLLTALIAPKAKLVLHEVSDATRNYTPDLQGLIKTNKN